MYTYVLCTYAKLPYLSYCNNHNYMQNIFYVIAKLDNFYVHLITFYTIKLTHIRKFSEN